eukprot:6201641-Pleurochrysis_carterae.AAC.3
MHKTTSPKCCTLLQIGTGYTCWKGISQSLLKDYSASATSLAMPKFVAAGKITIATKFRKLWGCVRKAHCHSSRNAHTLRHRSRCTLTPGNKCFLLNFRKCKQPLPNLIYRAHYFSRCTRDNGAIKIRCKVHLRKTSDGCPGCVSEDAGTQAQRVSARARAVWRDDAEE